MKLPVIKNLAENKTISQLRDAEEKLINGDNLPFEVKGDDEGEQLTHILGALDILERVENEKIDIKTATRAFFERVRSSIS
jgi:poly(A) polymerase Pap1